MRIFCLIILLFVADIIASAEESSTIENIRKLFESAASNETSCDQLITILGQVNDQNSTNLFQGYKGVAFMIQAKYNLNPYTKYNKFVKGKRILERAISKDGENIELRYLRFAIQNNAPEILGYNNNMEDDKKVLISELHKVSDTTLKKYSFTFTCFRSMQCYGKRVDYKKTTKKLIMAIYNFHSKQFLHTDIKTAWDFFHLHKICRK